MSVPHALLAPATLRRSRMYSYYRPRPPPPFDGVYQKDNMYYWRINALFVAMLLSAQLTGRVVGLYGMANVGAVFSCIYAMDK